MRQWNEQLGNAPSWNRSAYQNYLSVEEGKAIHAFRKGMARDLSLALPSFDSIQSGKCTVSMGRSVVSVVKSFRPDASSLI